MPTWKQLTFACNSLDADEIGDQLAELGAVSTTLENAEQSILVEPKPGSRPVWARVLIKGLFIDGDEPAIEPALETLLHQFPESHLSFVNAETIGEEDWQESWKQDYKPIQITEKLWICPSWTPAPNPQAINILVDPGLAFGTGSHPTTSMCLKWLSQHIQGDETVIDYGCGSGILAIAALKLGCKHATGVDIDPQSLIVSQDNSIKNKIGAGKLSCYSPSELPSLKADLIVANILANPLIELAPTIAELARPGARLALSGLLGEQAALVRETYAPHFTFEADQTIDGWVLLSAIKK